MNIEKIVILPSVTNIIMHKAFECLVLAELKKSTNNLEFQTGYQEGFIDCVSELFNNTVSKNKKTFLNDDTWFHVVNEIISELEDWQHVLSTTPYDEVDHEKLKKDVENAVKNYPNQAKMVQATITM